jgi:ubiquinone/menaquinone biosynthesis C-methylase UbiE
MAPPIDVKDHFTFQYNKVLKPATDVELVLYSKKTWPALKKYFKNNQVIADFGCGNAILLFNCYQESKTLNNVSLVGLDFAGVAFKAAKQLCPKASFIVSNVLSAPLKKNSIDIATSTQVIEHIDDEAFVKELARVLKPQGALLLTTVLKKKYAWYFRKNKYGERVIESTHLREYKKLSDVTSLLEKYGFKVAFKALPPINVSFVNFILDRLYNLTKIRFFLEIAANDFIVKLRKLTRIPIPGYYAIELIAVYENQR